MDEFSKTELDCPIDTSAESVRCKDGEGGEAVQCGCGGRANDAGRWLTISAIFKFYGMTLDRSVTSKKIQMRILSVDFFRNGSFESWRYFDDVAGDDGCVHDGDGGSFSWTRRGCT